MNSFQTNPDLFLQLLGQSIDDDLYQKFKEEFESSTFSRDNFTEKSPKTYDYDVLYKEKGIYLTILNNKVASIKFYLSPNPVCTPYNGKTVNGLSAVVDETQAIRKFNFVKKGNYDPNHLISEYIKENITIAFDSMTGEILHVEISQNIAK